MKNEKVLEKLRKEDILPTMVIHLEDDVKSDEWTVLDTGIPFILIENNNTHFASLYRVIENVYIDVSDVEE